MKLAVIILNWNGREMLARFLPSVLDNTVGDGVEVVVADNGSSDGSVDWLRENFPNLRIVEFSKNYGYAEGYNRAVDIIDAEYSLLLNSDVETSPGWWKPLLAFMQRNPSVGAVQPKLLSYLDKSRFEHAGAAGGLIDALGYPYARGRVLSRTERDEGQYDSDWPVEVAWASGAAMLVRTAAFKAVGGFDSNFFAHMEEIDLCWRLRLAGYGVFAVTESIVYHLGGGALPYGNPRKTYLNFRNSLLMLHKNLPAGVGKGFLVRRRLMDTFGFLFFLLQGKWADARAVVKAHNDFRKMRGQYREFPQENILPSLPGARNHIYSMYFKEIFSRR